MNPASGVGEGIVDECDGGGEAAGEEAGKDP